MIVDVPEPPAATVALLAIKLKLFADAPPTVTESVPVELAYVPSPEYVAEMVCAPVVAEVNVNAAAPFANASVDVCVVPSTATVSVPVGVTVLALEADATIIVITSLAPDAGVNVAADKVVVLATDVAVEPGHALNKLEKVDRTQSAGLVVSRRRRKGSRPRRRTKGRPRRAFVVSSSNVVKRRRIRRRIAR